MGSAWRECKGVGRWSGPQKEHLEEAAVSPRQEVQEILTAAGTSPLAEPATLAEILRRQDVDYGLIVKLGREAPAP